MTSHSYLFVIIAKSVRSFLGTKQGALGPKLDWCAGPSFQAGGRLAWTPNNLGAHSTEDRRMRRSFAMSANYIQKRGMEILDLSRIWSQRRDVFARIENVMYVTMYAKV